MKYTLTILIVIITLKIAGQGFDPGNPNHHCATAEEQRLYDLIINYRLNNKLPEIEFSKSLSYVARIHAMDLAHNRPDFGGCNPHSWSDKGTWSPCCYSRDENRILCMNNKPKELTTYKFKAWEVVYSGGEDAKAQDAFDLWKDISLMNDYLLNNGKWSKPWQAIGVGIYGDYACVWFGEGVDNNGKVPICGSLAVEPTKEPAVDMQVGDIKTKEEEPVLTDQEPQSTIDNTPDRLSDSDESNTGEKLANLKTVQISDTTTTYEKLESVPSINSDKNTNAKPQNDYYIIVSSTSTLGQADREVKRLIESGYKNAVYLPNSIFYRIAIDKFKDQASAYKALQPIKAEYPDAWLLKPDTKSEQKQ